jgi:hypothetical protein
VELRSPRSKFGRVSVLQKLAIKQRKKRRPGRPATGHDPIIPVRLPAKLVKDIDAWADVYRSERELEGMTRSTAIRCLILLGLERANYRAVDPKDQTTFEGPTAPLLKFYRGAKVTRWLMEGTGKKAKQRRVSPVVKPERRVQHTQPPTPDQVRAAADRADARSKERKP